MKPLPKVLIYASLLALAPAGLALLLAATFQEWQGNAEAAAVTASTVMMPGGPLLALLFFTSQSHPWWSRWPAAAAVTGLLVQAATGPARLFNTMTTDLTPLPPLLKRLQLGPMAATLPERIALARREQLDYASSLEIILADEVNRRAHRRIEMRLQQAGFQEICRLEDFDWSASITMDRRLLDAAFSLEFLARREHVLLVGPAGVGKSFLAQALGHSAVRAGHTVRFSHADDYFRVMNQARVDNSLERSFRTFLSPDLLILDDLGLHRFTAQQSADLYDLILNRHRASSFVITSNRALLEAKGVIDRPTAT